MYTFERDGIRHRPHNETASRSTRSGRCDSLRSAAESSVWSSGAVAAVAEFLDERRVRRLPVQIRSGLGRDRALVEQEDLGEVVAEAGSGFLVRAGDSSGCADGDGGGLGQLGDR